MKHIFISHAGEDSLIADRLATDLRNAGHDTIIDTGELSLGDDSIDFMNKGIADAHTVLILFSKHTENAKWQKLEISSAIWNEVEQDGGTCIVIRLDDTKFPLILGPKIYAMLDANDPTSYPKLFDGLCKAILPQKSASFVVATAISPGSCNPFRHLRAEYFEDQPELLAKTFAPPDALRLGALEDMKPCFLEGSRGTGKSMLLLSLRARIFLSRQVVPCNSIKIFGFYLKLTRGALCNAGIKISPGEENAQSSLKFNAQIIDISAQEIVIDIIEILFSELSYCTTQNMLRCDHNAEKVISESVDSILFPAPLHRATSFEELLEKLMNTHQSIAEFIRRRFIYNEQTSVPIATCDLKVLKRIIGLIRKNIPELSGAIFMVLLDEYENLFDYQQRVINGFVKLGPPDLTFKIAKKLGSEDTAGTTTGQELQETHDYARVSLVYDVEDKTQKQSYLDLLRLIVNNILRSEGFGATDIESLLPEDVTSEVDETKINSEVANLCKVSMAEFETWAPEIQREKKTYYREAAIYRVLYGAKGKHTDKRFSGFRELSFISSGVIRYFQEILSVAYYLTNGLTVAKGQQIVLPPENQTRAVNYVSQHNLTTLSRNVETDGERLKYFLLDLGDCLRYKLLKHTSEPEAARLTISDPERLNQIEMVPLQRLLFVGAREGVFQTKEGLPAFKPKHRSDPQPTEFNICRIYAPVLQISPRLRWRTEVKCSALLGLVSPDQRFKTTQLLKSEMVKTKKPDAQTTLFDNNL
jgi:hypothetical protein